MQQSDTTGLLSAPIHDPKSAPPDAVIEELPLDFSRLYAILYNSTDVQINIADTKAQIIVAANSILLASLALTSGPTANNLLWAADAPWTDRLALVAGLMMAAALVASIFFALRSSRPRLRGTKRGRNLFFFADVAGLDEDQYVAQLMDMTIQDVKQMVARQIHAKSVIVTAKYASIGLSLRFLFMGLLLWISMRVLLAL